MYVATWKSAAGYTMTIGIEQGRRLKAAGVWVYDRFGMPYNEVTQTRHLGESNLTEEDVSSLINSR